MVTMLIGLLLAHRIDPRLPFRVTLDPNDRILDRNLNEVSAPGRTEPVECDLKADQILVTGAAGRHSIIHFNPNQGDFEDVEVFRNSKIVARAATSDSNFDKPFLDFYDPNPGDQEGLGISGSVHVLSTAIAYRRSSAANPKPRANLGRTWKGWFRDGKGRKHASALGSKIVIRVKNVSTGADGTNFVVTAAGGNIFVDNRLGSTVVRVLDHGRPITLGAGASKPFRQGHRLRR